MDPLSVVGGLAAGIQLVSMGAQALLVTIKLVKDLKDVPQRLLVLLNDVDDSISRLCYSCNAGSQLFRMLDPPQLDRLAKTATALYPALQDIHKLLEPLVGDRQGQKTPVRRLWNSILSLKVQKELAEKLKRLDRLNMEVVRELGTVGLEVQVTTSGLVIAGNATSVQNFAKIEDKMDLLRSDFQKFTSSVQQSHAITLENHGASVPPGASGQPEDGKLLQERTEQLRRFLVSNSANGSPSPPNLSSPPNANLEFMFFSVRTYYTVGNFDASSDIVRDKLWKDTDLAIYLLKTTAGMQRGKSKSQTRALRLLKNSTADAFTTLNLNTASILIELMSTLAPINTTTCSYVREGLLQYLSQLAERQLPTGHPISLIINKLKDDKGDNNVTLGVLTFITERLRATVGPLHQLTQLATKRICALLRRSGEYAEALRIASEGVRGIRATLGPNSLQERLLSRQLEHVYIDQKDWTAALGVCLDIVGQQQLDSPDPDPQYHDECAVYTMEDIAKIFECAGNLDQAIAWLKQAKISGGMLWGPQAALGHIQDKLSELLTLTGREAELKLWHESVD
ncbi:hypothetical protein EKO27_g4649 [Xylaria grammica]|uniref:Fungal N-terminal domain-containing protein n=1 Tax=Xylaria grammica TaxID=363999 RepID=A0A439D7S4_9PEZI|nr:hypothetical protein EKO27_g4649 [Xylaria grammica]